MTFGGCQSGPARYGFPQCLRAAILEDFVSVSEQFRTMSEPVQTVSTKRGFSDVALGDPQITVIEKKSPGGVGRSKLPGQGLRY